MNEDITESIFFCLLKIGIKEKDAYQIIKDYHDDLIKLANRAEMEAEFMKELILKNKLYLFLSEQAKKD